MSVQLFRGDCLEVMKNLPDHSVDAIICDLPFGITRAKWDQEIDLEVLWSEYLRIAKRNAVIALHASQPFTSKLVLSQPRLFRFMYYWQKTHATNFLRTSSQPLRVIEEICIFSQTAQYTYNPMMSEMGQVITRGLPTINSDLLAGRYTDAEGEEASRTYTHRHPRNLIDIPRDHSTAMLVPTQKPVALAEYLITTFTNPGDTVFDNTMGSGTTGVAAVNTGRKFVGIEKLRKHYEIAKRRIYALPNVEVSENPHQRGAQTTHFIRTSKHEKAIQEAIRTAKRQRMKITKTLIAQMVGLSREQVSKRYGHMFEAKPQTKSSLTVDQYFAMVAE